jgi:hypothetical protein
MNLGQIFPTVYIKVINGMDNSPAGMVRILVQDENRRLVEEGKTDLKGEFAFIDLGNKKRFYFTPQVDTSAFVFKPANALVTVGQTGTILQPVTFKLWPVDSAFPPPPPPGGSPPSNSKSDEPSNTGAIVAIAAVAVGIGLWIYFRK